MLNLGLGVTKINTFRSVTNLVAQFTKTVNDDGGTIHNLSLVENLLINKKPNTLEILAPLASKPGKLYGLMTPAYATVVRNSVATYIAPDGFITNEVANVPRFEQGTILIEPEDTNLLHYSLELNTNRWVLQSGITVQEGYPDVFGGNSAYRLSGGGAYQFASFNGGTVFHSFWLKGELGGEVIKSKDPTWGNYVHEFVLTTEWQKYTYADDTGHATGTGNWLQQLPATGIYFSGSQCSTQDLSYIHSPGAPTTRPADVMTFTPPEGTVSIVETIDGVEQTPITTIPPTYTLPYGNVNKIEFLS